MAAIDPILVSVLHRRLKSIAEQMGITLLRTTRSPILNEARDCVTGLYDAQGRMLEQCEYTPILAFALQPACQYIVKYYGDEIYPGDVILHNDVFSQGGQLPDVAVFKPIFVDDRLVAWAAAKGHQADIGGAQAGGYNPNAREVWQEGLRIPPIKVSERGRLRRDVWDLIFANIRFRIVEDDIRAEIGAATVGERGMQQLVAQMGLQRYLDHVEHLLDSTERMMRSEIEAIPDGTYTGSTYFYYDGVTEGSKYRLQVAVTVRGGEIRFDYTGTDPQAPGFTNASHNASVSALLATFLMHVNPQIPHNEGMLRPLSIHIPEGTVLNARFPAATTFGNHLTDPHSEALLSALSQAIPHKVTAAWNRMLGFTVTGRDPRRHKPYVDILFISMKGGSGGTEGADGCDHIGIPMRGGGITAQDPEIFELQDPHLLLRFEYARDSAG
ncbi:MAG: hydantoinase B/oxoprolinase family protein, partial [Deltaproteobacteria bacterium]|nr:hydantoinase B/oxoprolinase family protein [Deltaproteobacteria bacterium]